jgi:hypothetical protein
MSTIFACDTADPVERQHRTARVRYSAAGEATGLGPEATHLPSDTPKAEQL